VPAPLPAAAVGADVDLELGLRRCGLGDVWQLHLDSGTPFKAPFTHVVGDDNCFDKFSQALQSVVARITLKWTMTASSSRGIG
jgi:hypothetical protein